MELASVRETLRGLLIQPPTRVELHLDKVVAVGSNGKTYEAVYEKQAVAVKIILISSMTKLELLDLCDSLLCLQRKSSTEPCDLVGVLLSDKRIGIVTKMGTTAFSVLRENKAEIPRDRFESVLSNIATKIEPSHSAMFDPAFGSPSRLSQVGRFLRKKSAEVLKTIAGKLKTHTKEIPAPAPISQGQNSGHASSSVIASPSAVTAGEVRTMSYAGTFSSLMSPSVKGNVQLNCAVISQTTNACVGFEFTGRYRRGKTDAFCSILSNQPDGSLALHATLDRGRHVINLYLFETGSLGELSGFYESKNPHDRGIVNIRE